MPRTFPLLPLVFLALPLCAAERINQEGRILGPAPVVSASTLFDTAQADAIVSAMQIFPLTSAWNEDISQRPLLANSAAMIGQITSSLASNRRTLRAFYEMNYVLVPDNQPDVPINFFNYPDESDPSPYPIPSNLPIESWPVETGNLTLLQWEEDVNDTGGDRHSITVMPGLGRIWETWETQLVNGSWQASNGAEFDLTSNTLRTAGYTSGDAAGLPMFPALVRYDECQRGMVEHAMRIVVAQSRAQYLYPANHYASSIPASSVNYPAMGQRVRLQAGFVIPSTWTIYEKAVCLGLKKYGALVADNGGFFSISVCPDDRYPADAFDDLSSIAISNFDIIQTTGATEGPRSPGAPTASAGPDQFITLPDNTASLAANITGTNLAIQWTQYSGPGTASFANSAQTSTMATFSAPGVYTLMVSAGDGIHAVARDALHVTVTLPVTITRAGDDIQISFPSAASHTYRVERTTSLATGNWNIIADNLAGDGNVQQITDANVIPSGSAFYRVVQTSP